MRVSYAIIFVGDMQRAVSFYRDIIGLPMKFQSPGWTEFSIEGASLVLHASKGSDSMKDDPLRVPSGRCRPGLSVPDIDEFHKRMLRNKCTVHSGAEGGLWRPCGPYMDPDGLTFSVGEERPTG
jgi:lactoylglutathione lyase